MVLQSTAFLELTKPGALNLDQSCSCSAPTNRLGIERLVASRVVRDSEEQWVPPRQIRAASQRLPAAEAGAELPER